MEELAQHIPGRNSGEKMAEEPRKNSVEEMAENPRKNSPEKMTGGPIKNSVEEMAEDPRKNSLEKMAEGPSMNSVEKMAKIPSSNAVERIAEWPSMNSVEKMVKTLSKNSVEKMAKIPSSNAVERMAEGPSRNPAALMPMSTLRNSMKMVEAASRNSMDMMYEGSTRNSMEKKAEDSNRKPEELIEDPKWNLKEIKGFRKEILENVKLAAMPLDVDDPIITIRRVPESIYKVDEEAYKMRYVWLVADRRYDMDFSCHTIRHLHSILSRNPTKTLEAYLMEMYYMTEKIRDCHYIIIEVDFQILIWLVINSCFVVDLLLMLHEGTFIPSCDPDCASFFLPYLWTDLLLVENQLPFFVLQRVFDMAIVNKSKYPSLVELALRFFDQFLDINMQTPPMESSSVHHLLHLVHYHLLPSKPPKATHYRNYKPLKQIFSTVKKKISSHHSQLPISQPFKIKPLPSARRLQEAGIKFRKKEGSGFMDITFNKGVLEIPYLHVHSNTKIVLRNLIAWEQCHQPAGVYFTGYAIFMDYIINTVRDIEILSHSGIIEHSLGTDEDVALVFNGLSTNIIYKGNGDDFLPNLCKEVNRYCKNRYNIWCANLMTNYFSNPWTVISLIAAVFLIMLTMTQTFYSAFSYSRPPK
ncbi:UPF0481 protein At3g47200-like [Aristolochia californica]|uniref:UPF0481 protein At3g47200-like n=1 Tax=Aristolochia californica TaxID=171875 RepID=UPI0035E26D78